MIRIIIAIVATAVLSLSAAVPVHAAPEDSGADKVLVIGIDGVRWDLLQKAATPAMDKLAKGGLLGRSNLYVSPAAQTSSGPGWSTIATGVWPDKHGVTSNDLSGNKFGTYPDFLTRLENGNSSLSTFSMTNWGPLGRSDSGGPVFSDKIDSKHAVAANGHEEYRAEDAKIADLAADRLRNQDPDAGFVYFGEPDEMAHANGTGAGYLASIERVDAYIGRLVSAIEDRPSHGDERWQILVTTDHGHVDGGGHGGSHPQERQTWVIANGAGIPAGVTRHTTRAVDVALTALNHLGVKPSGLDGRTVTADEPDAFESVRDALKPRQDETEIPADVIGWTHETPEGWSIDNSAMPDGGMTEWRGWALTTDDFWAATQRDQNRENFLRGRGVIAVADSDEWADGAGGTGTFDSTLVSPGFPVTGGGTARLSYGSHYVQEGSQVAQVAVSFDGGEGKEVKRYASDAANLIENLEVPVPDGASKMTVKFRLSGATNNWFWAVDSVAVE